jgi:phage terminase large subunit-like protein
LPIPVFRFVGDVVSRVLPDDAFQYTIGVGQEKLLIGDPVPGTTYYPEGSYRILAPMAKSFRGWSADLVIYDEAREQSDFELVDAALPTLAARANPQTWFASNAADITGVVLRELRRRGTSDDPGDLAYMEWSADEDLPIDDPAGWVQANPALGFHLNERSLRSAFRTMGESAFRTERLCQFVDAVTDLAFPLDAWKECRVAPSTPARPVSLAVDIDPNRSEAAAVAAWDDGERIQTAVLGTWFAPLDDKRIADEVEVMRRNIGAQVVEYDAYTTWAVANHLGEDRVHRVGGPEIVAASSAVFDAVADHRIGHPDDPYLNDAVAATGRRPAGDGGWRITRKGDVPIPAAVALVLAVFAALHPAPTPMVHSR